MDEQYKFNTSLLAGGVPTNTPPAFSNAPVIVQNPPQQAQPVNTTDVINKAVTDGIKQEKRANALNQVTQEAGNVSQTIQQAADFLGIPQDGSLKQLSDTRFFQRGLLDATKQYMQAQQAGDEAGMNAAHERAVALRDYANQNGIDMSSFGDDRSYAQKQAAYDVANQQRYSNLLDTKSSGDVYNERYDYYLGQGMSKKYADRFATEEAEKYQRNYLRTLNDEFYANGIDPRTGAISNYGWQMVGLMRDEDPQSIETIVAGLPAPMQEYVFNQLERQKDNELARRLGLMNNQYGWQERLQGEKLDSAERLAQLQADLQKYGIDSNVGLQKFLASLGIGGSGSSGGSAKNSGRRYSDEKQLTPKQEEYANKLDSAYLAYEEAVTDPNMTQKQHDELLDNINAIRDEMIKSGAFKKDDPLLDYYLGETMKQYQIAEGRLRAKGETVAPLHN